MPFVRHQDKSMYFRQVGDAVGIGSYRHEHDNWSNRSFRVPRTFDSA
jgi:hypothetical protein